MADVQFWDTKGVTNMQGLVNGRLGLKFTGEDGINRVLTIPGDHVATLVLSLIDFASKITKTHNVGDVIKNAHRMSVESLAVGSAADGSEYSLLVRTNDQLEAHFRLPADVAESLAAGLVSTLAEHGRQPTSLTTDDPKH